MSRRSMFPCLILVALLAACGSTSSSPQSSAGTSSYAGKTLQLGAAISLTGAGAVYGPAQRNGIELAVDAINSSGGVNGARVAVDVEDDASSPQQAAQVFQAFITSKNVLGILGPTLSNSAVAAHPFADKQKTPVVAVSNTGLQIVGDCPYPCTYIFRDSLGESQAVPANVNQFVDTHHPSSAVILYANDDKFSSDDETIFKKALSDRKVNVAGEVAFSKNEVDFRPFATTAMGYHPDVVIISALGGPASKLMVALRALGYAGPILGGNGFNTNPV
ncbi:MAG TPA: ABC transporter substrate-binding protein, partial [Candidatus Sulfotelmatobacter sp.]|nr:ABC transporter substrate-binding protein [Candidatus Sulfotelmatobacter sp.]